MHEILTPYYSHRGSVRSGTESRIAFNQDTRQALLVKERGQP